VRHVLCARVAHLTHVTDLFRVHHTYTRAAATVLRAQVTRLIAFTDLTDLFRVHHTFTHAAAAGVSALSAMIPLQVIQELQVLHAAAAAL